MKTFRNLILLLSILPFFIAVFSYQNSYAQAEVMGWGNLQGIRIDGELMEFNTSICIVDDSWTILDRTAKEAQERPIFRREGDQQILTTRIDSLFITQKVTDVKKGQITLDVEIESREPADIRGVFMCLELPSKYYSASSFEYTGSQNSVTKINAGSPKREINIDFESPAFVHTTLNGENPIALIALIDGKATEKQNAVNSFTISVNGEIDNAEVTLNVDTAVPGRAFDGLGGNFRLQNQRFDPMVIDYNLKNLRVSMARLQMRWWNWHPEEEQNPIAQANSGNLHPGVQAEMELAQRMAKMDIPVLLAVWTAPNWAIEGERRWSPGPDGVWGNPLNQEKSDAIYESITSYIIYLKNNYGVEVEYFSFNESDLGINVRQTGAEHSKFIKGLGSHLASKGLKTKLLLGDTADANGWQFLKEAMEDPETHKYIGAVSFHSWRGWDYETLEKWDQAARTMNVPLIVGEGSTDAAAWRFPIIFDEPTFAQQEITLYTRILSICEPKTILQWQLTSDYSILAGGGLFGNNDEELRPTQRFWNLKQLAETPQGSFHLPVTSSSETVIPAALGETAKGLYTLHIVNNGAERTTTISGLPDSVRELQLYFTGTDQGMENMGSIEVNNGSASFTLPALGFASLYTTNQSSQ